MVDSFPSRSVLARAEARAKAVFCRRLPLLCLAVPLLASGLQAARLPQRETAVPLCRGVTLSASYLVEAGPDGLPGFQFSLSNHTVRSIRLAEPVPSSAHWYALSGGRWLWRASNGSGGALLNALSRYGPVFAYSDPDGRAPQKSILVGPRQTKTWIESARQNPVLAYNPGCPRCSYPGERDYRVVFAYAYLPGVKDGRRGWLHCGLRSKPVPMPPKPSK